MPSPVGHALGALAAGWMASRPAAPRRALLVQAGLLAALGTAPDLDLLIGRHSAETHSVGAALLVAAAAAFWRWPIASTRPRIFLAACLAWMTHPLFDAFGADTSEPLGVMAFWPFSAAYHFSDWSAFAPISRRWYLPGFLEHNLRAVVHEVLLMVPIAALVYWWRTWSPRAAGQRSRRPAS